MVLRLSNRLACSTNCYHGFDLDTALKGISKTGFSYVELASVKDYTEHVMPEQMTDQDLTRLKSRLSALSLTPISLSGHSNLTDQAGVESLKRRIEMAENLNMGVVNSGPGNLEAESQIPTLVSNLKHLAKYAQRKGVVVAVETHGLVMGSGEAAAAVVRKVGSPWIKVNYDTGNVIFYGGVRPEVDLKKTVKYLAHVHLKDKRGGRGVWDFPALGSGEVDFDNLLHTLSEEGYSGPVSVEVEVIGKGKTPPWLVPEDATTGGLKEDVYRNDKEAIDRALRQSYRFIRKYF
ncbi:MAG: sugar phosphate isomerase/epimerase family protein [Candidatus Bathyarchaeia archaeon]